MKNRSNFSNPEDRRHPSNHPVPESAVENNRVMPEDFNGHPISEDELAYQDGYVQGRTAERVEQVEETQRSREANSVGAGAIIGVLMATVAGLVLAMLYLTPNQQTGVAPTETQVAPAALPASPQPTSPSSVPITPTQPQLGTQPASPLPNQVTVIERVPAVQPSVTQPVQPSVQPQPVQPQPVQPQTGQSQVIQPTVQPNATAQPNVTGYQDQPLVPPTSPTDPYQSPQPSVITPPGSVGQP
ncbi:MAG: hypothetical protein ACKO7W_23885 [Elainella sp.]